MDKKNLKGTPRPERPSQGIIDMMNGGWEKHVQEWERQNPTSWDPIISKFKIGDKAYKTKGYKFPCTIVSIFKTTKGEARVVGEMDDYGLLHIFNEDQLEKSI